MSFRALLRFVIPEVQLLEYISQNGLIRKRKKPSAGSSTLEPQTQSEAAAPAEENTVSRTSPSPKPERTPSFESAVSEKDQNARDDMKRWKDATYTGVKENRPDLTWNRQTPDTAGNSSHSDPEEAAHNPFPDAAKAAEDKLDLELLRQEASGTAAKEPFQLEKRLDGLIGLDSAKSFILKLGKQIFSGEQKKGSDMVKKTDQSLNMIFTGSRGTGKKTIAGLMADMLEHTGAIKKGQVTIASSKDLASGSEWEAAKKTKDVAESAKGGVLFIDGADVLLENRTGATGEKAAEELTRLAEVYKDNLIIILAGDSDRMEELLKVNTALASHFPKRLAFADYSAEEMVQLTESMADSDGFALEGDVPGLLLEWYRAKQSAGKNEPANGQLVRRKLDESLQRHALRTAHNNRLPSYELTQLTSDDFGLTENKTGLTAEQELERLTGLNSAKNVVKGLVAQVENKQRRKELGLPDLAGQGLHMVFKGNDGTGKTTVARLIAKRLNEMAFLTNDGVLETSYAELEGNTPEQTALEMKNVIEKARGRILFIDEAHKLAKDSYKDAVHTLADAMEDENNDVIVIMAGEDRKMEDLLNLIPGFRLRFPNSVTFPDYRPDELLKISRHLLHEKGYLVSESAEKALLQLFKDEATDKNKTGGNAKLARYHCEQAVRNHEKRYSRTKDASYKELITIDEEDLAAGRRQT